MMRTALLVLNFSASLISAGWAMAALIRPTSLSNSANPSNGEKFYARMYAARSIPFGLLTAIMPFWAEERAVAWLLFTAAVIQIADVVIGMESKARQMMIGASIAATIHILCGFAVL